MNTPPRIKRAEMVPALPKAGTDINLAIDAYDVDGDTVYYKYKWTLNGKYISDQNYLSMDLKRDNMIVVEITPYDSENAGGILFVKSKIYNSPPAVTEGTPSFDGKTYKYTLNSTDADGDELTYEIKDGPEGMTVDRNGMITWEPGGDAGTHRFTIIVSDNNGGTVIVPITTRISFEENEQSN